MKFGLLVGTVAPFAGESRSNTPGLGVGSGFAVTVTDLGSEAPALLLQTKV